LGSVRAAALLAGAANLNVFTNVCREEPSFPPTGELQNQELLTAKVVKEGPQSSQRESKQFNTRSS
jgi:hypothetical protein